MTDMNEPGMDPLEEELPSPVPSGASKAPEPESEPPDARPAAFDERPAPGGAMAQPAGMRMPFEDEMDDGLEDAALGEGQGIDRILEIPLTIHVELGRKRVRIRELLELGAGSVLTLAAQAGAPLSIYANKTLIAEGEAVVVGERYGVRVTDIVSPAERVKRLGGDD